MQGRQGPDEDFWREVTGQHRAISNGNSTGKHRSVPPRPSTMRRVQRPPATPRVGRPQREETRGVNWRRRLLIWGAVFAICGFLACFISYAAVNFFAATSATANAAQAATTFLTNAMNRDYHAAYQNLDAGSIAISMPENQFKQQSQLDDSCYGPITHFSEIAGSASVQANSQGYSYSITRSKLPHPYTLKLTLVQDEQGNWKVSSFGSNNDLGPGQQGTAGCS